jgi:hypothetical protein
MFFENKSVSPFLKNAATRPARRKPGRLFVTSRRLFSPRILCVRRESLLNTVRAKNGFQRVFRPTKRRAVSSLTRD